MRIAALYDVHGNLPALEAVLAEVEAEDFDLVVVGGDVVAGPMPAEVLERLRGLDLPTRWVMGNADREVVAFFDEPEQPADGHWRHPGDAWAAGQLSAEQRDVLAAFEPVVVAGEVLFCHASPRSDHEEIAAVTTAERLRPMLAGVEQRLVVCGHTHHQFALEVDGVRVVNAGSVGMPFEGDPAAFWLSVDDGEPRHRRTAYDVEAAAEAMRATGFPDVDEVHLRDSLLEPVSRDWVDGFYAGRAGFTARGERAS